MPLNSSAVASWVLNFAQRHVGARAEERHNFTAY
jgi:hypothetical protein